MLHDKAFHFVKNPRYDGYQRGLDSMLYNFFDKKAADDAVKNEIIRNKELADELNKPIVRKFEKPMFGLFLWKVKKGIIITNALQKKLDESGHRTYKGSDFYNRPIKSWLEKNEIYSTHNDGKSVVAERFIRTLKNEIYKHMTSVSKKIV